MSFIYCIYNIFNNTIKGYRIVNEDTDRAKVRKEMREWMFSLDEDGNVLIDSSMYDNIIYEKDLANFCNEVVYKYAKIWKG